MDYASEMTLDARWKSLDFKDVQAVFFEEAELKFGFTLKRIGIDSSIAYETVRSWKNGALMPLEGFLKIIGIDGFPNELSSRVAARSSKAIVDSEPEDCDLDNLAVAAVAVLQRYVAARHPDSPGGIVIDHREKPDIYLAAGGLIDRAAKVAA